MRTKSHALHVEELLEAKGLDLELLAGSEGLSRTIKVADVQKPGLALAGHLESLHPERIQVMGFSEVTYLETLSPDVAQMRVRELCVKDLPCAVVTRGLDIPGYLVSCCNELAVPLLRTGLSSERFLRQLKSFLSFRLNPVSTGHGVLVDVFGVGILLLGKSGIGKSEVALDLVLRGHRLVADDIVEMQRVGPALIGSGPDIIKHHMEIRGLGILNIKDLFGVSAVRDTKRIDLAAELIEWDEEDEYDRLGVEDQTYSMLGIEIQLLRLPVRHGRSMSAIIEVAARNQLLKVRGHYSAREFQDRLARAIAQGRSELASQGSEE